MFQDFVKNVKKKFPFDGYHVFIVFVFCLWGYLFRGFLLERLALVNDAIPYHGHIKFFIDNISKGVYPLWDPVRNCGVPNEFFLRRIGDFNPFYFLIILYQKIGLPYNFAYLGFLATYFFVGMIGFYKLARCLFKEKIFAVFALMLILFSSLGTRLFASYIILIFVPIIWFFFFLVSFSIRPQPYKLIGMTFSLMLILTTYIPFYFLTALISFLLLFVVIYIEQLKGILFRYFKFIRTNKLCTLLCLCALIASLYPGVMLYKEGAKRQFVLPVRHSNSPTANVLGVNEKRTEPGIFAHLKIDKLISNLDEIELKVFYVPFFVYLLFLWGGGIRVNRRIFLLLAWIFSLFLIGSPEATAVNSFLFKHIFYFKYFRNLRFFLWVAILPAVVVLSAEYLRNLLSTDFSSLKNRVIFLSFNSLAHLGFLIFLQEQDNVILSTYIALGMSFCFFVLYSFKPNMQKSLIMVFLFMIVFVQPAEVFSYLNQNSEKVTETYKNPQTTYLRYNRPYQEFSFVRKNSLKRKTKESGDLIRKPAPVYIATKNYHRLRNNINENRLKGYLNNKFIVYDSVVSSQGLNKDMALFNKNIAKNKDEVIFSPAFKKNDLSGKTASANSSPTPIFKEGQGLDILSYDVNSIRVRTDFKDDKFLVYNDNIYPGWEAYLNKQKVKLYTANVSFKGIFLPRGENIVFFRFGSTQDYFIKYFLMLIFNVVFWSMVILWVKSDPCEGVWIDG